MGRAQANWRRALAGAGLVAVTFIAAGRPSTEQVKPRRSPVNLNHILALVESLQMGGRQVTYVNIYAEHPAYEPVAASGEGISAVDDVGRLLEVLETEILVYGRSDLLPLTRGLTQFLLEMQREDGLWYNFIRADGSINTTHRNSAAGFGWWAARGLRGLAAAYCIFRDRDPEFAGALQTRFQRADRHLQASLAGYPALIPTAHGQRASWLPQDAPDMSAEFLLALAKMTRHSELDYREQIGLLAEGLMTYQLRDPESPADGMFYSWKNRWHNWGNLQALALLEAFSFGQDSTLLQAVERWADGFLRWEADQGYLWEVTAASVTQLATVPFPQIAYGIGSSFKGIHRLASLTGQTRYNRLAQRLLGWFSGDNRAGQSMYDAATGRCYDGINGPSEVNLNSGAESTIEALQALQFAHPIQNEPERQPDDPGR